MKLTNEQLANVQTKDYNRRGLDIINELMWYNRDTETIRLKIETKTLINNLFYDEIADYEGTLFIEINPKSKTAYIIGIYKNELNYQLVIHNDLPYLFNNGFILEVELL